MDAEAGPSVLVTHIHVPGGWCILRVWKLHPGTPTLPCVSRLWLVLVCILCVTETVIIGRAPPRVL